MTTHVFRFNLFEPRAHALWPFVLQVACYEPDLLSRLCPQHTPAHLCHFPRSEASSVRISISSPASSSQVESEAAGRQIKAHRSQVSCSARLLAVLCVRALRFVDDLPAACLLHLINSLLEGNKVFEIGD